METETETERDVETERETDNTRTWTWTQTQTRTWNLRTFATYFIRRNCPYSTKWNAAEISRRNFQWRYILVAPLPLWKRCDMQILKNSYRCWNSSPNDVLAELELEISV
jgi:hypothetical protein